MAVAQRAINRSQTAARGFVNPVCSETVEAAPRLSAELHVSLSRTLITRITSMKRLLAFAITVALSGCAFHRTPYVTYEGSPPLSSTAVFASLDEGTVKS